MTAANPVLMPPQRHIAGSEESKFSSVLRRPRQASSSRARTYAAPPFLGSRLTTRIRLDTQD